MDSKTAIRTIKRFAWKNPTLYRTIAILRRRRNFTDLSFDVCVGGFPRSANSYVQKMLEITQPGLRVKSHHHHPAVIIHSINLRKPVLFLIRKPEDAILSWCIHQQKPVKWVLDYYIDYHSVLLPYLDRLLIVPFDKAVGSFRPIVMELNSRSCLNLDIQFDEEEAKQLAWDSIKRGVLQHDGSIDHRRLHLPSQERAKMKNTLYKEFFDETHTEARVEAAYLFARISEELKPWKESARTEITT